MNRFDPDGRVSFDEADHRYVLDGTRELVSVTQAIGEAFVGLLGEQYYNDQARQRGSAVHCAIMLDVEASLDEDTVHPIVRPYFDAFRKFIADEQPELIASESIVFDEEHAYAGMLDYLGVLRGPHRARSYATDHGFSVIDLVDWKSGLIPWSVGMQLAAYRRCVRRVYGAKTIIRSWALKLNDDGSYQLEDVSAWPDYRAHEHDVLAAIRIANLRRARRRTLPTKEYEGVAV